MMERLVMVMVPRHGMQAQALRSSVGALVVDQRGGVKIVLSIEASSVEHNPAVDLVAMVQTVVGRRQERLREPTPVAMVALCPAHPP